MDIKNSSNSKIQSIIEFSIQYSKIHGWLALTICLIGTVFNLLNIILLRRCTFKSNLILITIACCDIIVMICNIPSLIHFNILNSSSILSLPNQMRDTKFWIAYSLISVLICITSHSFSIWLTVYLSLYRLLIVNKSLSTTNSVENYIRHDRGNCLTKYFLSNIKKTMFLIFIFCLLFCIPTYMHPRISNETLNYNNTNQTYFFIDYNYLNIKSNNLIFKIKFYLQAILGKIVPAFILGVFILLILRYLIVIENNKERIVSKKVINKKKK